MSNILNLVSLARKARKLEVGEEPTVAAARSHQAKLILVAVDAADNTYRRVRNACGGGNVTWVSTPYSKLQLGSAVGRGETAMVAVMDIGLEDAMIRGLAADDPEKYAIPLERLTQKNDKAQKRLEEKRRHEKNLRTGKYQAKQAAQPRQEEQPKPAAPPADRKPGGRTGGGSRPPHSRPYRKAESGKQKGRRKGHGRSNPYEHFDREPQSGKHPPKSRGR